MNGMEYELVNFYEIGDNTENIYNFFGYIKILYNAPKGGIKLNIVVNYISIVEL